MADSDSRANWQQTAKLALSIVAVVGIVIVPRLPQSVVRPNVSPPAENRFVSAQSVDARLWQDPFEAVDAEREQRRAAGPANPAAVALEAWRTSAASMQQQVEERAGETLAPPLVLLTFAASRPSGIPTRPPTSSPLASRSTTPSKSRSAMARDRSSRRRGGRGSSRSAGARSST